MRKNGLSFTEAKRIPIPDYLSGLGFEPASVRGMDYWYHSPFREERTPSFKVNTRLNVWFDHGTGEGGTILDLGAKLNGCSLSEFVEMLSGETLGTRSLQQQPILHNKPENKLEIISVNDLTGPDMIQYLVSRCIDPETARKYCKEIEFRIGPRVYTAIGFENRSRGYELRNRWFKGSSSPKDISLIDRGSSRICVLEGFMDFLSLLKIEEPRVRELAEHSNFLVLNSLRLLTRSLPIIQAHHEASLFLDNDSAARDAKDSLTVMNIKFHDGSLLFVPHKDLNDYLIAIHRARSGPDFSRSMSAGLKR